MSGELNIFLGVLALFAYTSYSNLLLAVAGRRRLGGPCLASGVVLARLHLACRFRCVLVGEVRRRGYFSWWLSTGPSLPWTFLYFIVWERGGPFTVRACDKRGKGARALRLKFWAAVLVL